MKYRKKPIVIEAVQLNEANEENVRAFVSENAIPFEFVGEWTMIIHTLDGDMRADKDDWIIKEPFPTDDRRFYPCKPDIFEATYEPIEA